MDKYYTSQTIIDDVAMKINNLLKSMNNNDNTNDNTNNQTKQVFSTKHISNTHKKSKKKITKPNCIQDSQNSQDSQDIYIVDFSAGDGRLGTKLIELGVSPSRIIEYDIEPKHERIKQADWLQIEQLPSNVKQFILTFNPPFGKSCHTACQFIDKALQLPNTRVVASFLVLPLYPIMFDNAKTHKIDLLPTNSFTFDDEVVSAPACLHEVISRPSGFLNFKLYTALTNKPYYADISQLSNIIATNSFSTRFTDVKHRLPIALVRNNGHYAGLTAIIIEKDKCTLYYSCDVSDTNDNDNTISVVKQIVKEWNIDTDSIPQAEFLNKRPWLSNDSRWRLTSFKDDIENGTEKGRRIGCGSLKILPPENKPNIEPDVLHKTIKQFVQYVADNKNAVRGGGNGPKNIGVGTFYWITTFALAEDV